MTKNDTTSSAKTEMAVFGAGCFWGIEEAFRQLPGVVGTAVGYMGGNKENPTYEEVCFSETGHAEVVEVTFDPAVVAYEKLLNIFWKNHNPTTRNRQGPNIGTEYRSVIFTFSEEQKRIAEESKLAQEKAGFWKAPIVTDITPATTFWKAEDYHQQYLAKRGLDSCHI